MKKLHEKYEPAQYKVEPNILYQYFEKVFFDALKTTPQIDTSKENITENGWEYNLSSDEIDFYLNNYISFSEPVDYKSSLTLQKYFDEKDISKLRVGARELDLLDFLDINDQHLIILGDVGWGKTTKIRYAYYFLFTLSKKLSQKFIPIYFSMELFKNKIEACHTRANLQNILNTEIIKPRIEKLTHIFTSINDEQFWDFAKQTSDFSYLKTLENDLKEIFATNKDELRKAVYNERKYSRTKPEFQFVALKYLKEKKNLNAILIIDNTDPLDADINTMLMWEFVSFAQRFNCKTVISLRQNTWWKIFHNNNGLNAALPHAKSPAIRPNAQIFLENKSKAISTELEKSKISIIYRDKVITFQDSLKILKSMINIMNHKEVQLLFDNIAGGDLKKWARLLRKYFQTGYIQDEEMVRNILGNAYFPEEVPISSYDVPMWVALSSIITNNHYTYFSSRDKDNEQDIMLNLFCNGKQSFNPYLIRLNILSFIKRKAPTTVENFLRLYKYLFNDLPVEIYEHDTIDAFLRLNKARLIQSPIKYEMNNESEVKKLVDVSLSDTGKYFYERMINYFEYISFMKDDVALPEGYSEIIDCIKESSLHNKYKNVYKFVEFFYSQELKTINNMDSHLQKAYLEQYSLNEEQYFFSYGMATSMIEFGKKREALKQILFEFSNLLNMISLKNNELINSMDK